MRPGDLAPDDSDLGTADLLGCAVDESDLLAEVEAVLYQLVTPLPIPSIVLTWQPWGPQHPQS